MFNPSAPVPSVTALDLEGLDLRRLTNRLIRRVNLARRAAMRPATVATLARLSEPASQRRMLFVVGAARSGTTAMQTALNASAEVFLLGEANLFRENLKPGFRARYNAQHRDGGLPPSKQTECPEVAPENTTWVEIVAALAMQHRFVGEKVAFGAYEPDRFVSEFLAFHRRHFHAAAYILAFRNPRDAILSPRSTWGIQTLAPWALSYITATRGLIRLRRNFPRTVPVFLETVEHSTFRRIEQCLDCPMPQLSAHMFRKAASPCDPERVPPELRETVAELEGLYPMLREAIESGSASDPNEALDSIDGHLAGLRRRLGLASSAPGSESTRFADSVRPNGRPA
jgi:hypothetical protein